MGRSGAAHHNETLRLTDLVSSDRPELVDVVFTNCVIRGPAMLQPVDSRLSDNDYGIGPDQLEAALWVLNPWTPTVHGAIMARRCGFIGCTFDGIAFVGGPELAATLLHAGSGVPALL